MKILQITNKVPFPPKDGGAIATLNLALGLSEHGHEVSILAMNTSKHYLEHKDVPESLTRCVNLITYDINTDLCWKDALKNLLFSDLPYNASRFFDEGFEKRLQNILQQNSFDIIQLEGLYLAYYIKTIRKFAPRGKIALRAHNIEHEIWSRTAQQEKKIWKKWYFRLLARRIKSFKLSILNTYDFLIPITQRDAETFVKLGNTQALHVSPAGYTAAQKARRDLIEFPTLGFIGTLDWFPNQEALMWFVEKVWPDLQKKYPQLHLNIAGRNAPEWLSRFLNARNNLNYLGEIEDAQEFLNKTAIMIVPLFSGSGMRVKIIEGMALGKTIVTTSIGAEGIPVSPGQNIFIEDSPQAFMNQIDFLINNRKKFDEVGTNAIKFVNEHFDNKTICAKLADFYITNK